MSQPALIIRADASPRIGAGHVLRSLAIAQQWRDAGGNVCFASAAIPPAIQQRLDSEGIPVKPISSTIGSLDDAAELVSLAQADRAIAIVLDGYQFGSDYQAAIQRFDLRTLCIDDNAHLTSYNTDLVLNQNLGAAPDWYAGKSVAGELLLGTRFALIRTEFTGSQRKPIGYDAGVHRVLVTLGGSDPNNATGVVIEGLSKIPQPDLEFRVIVGHLNEARDQLAEQVSTDRRFELISGVRDMSEHYRWADFAITAGGSTNWELCYYGIPRIVLVIADNQRDIARQLHELGVAENVGEAADVTAPQIAERFQAFTRDFEKRRAASRAAMELVDGQGAARCIAALGLDPAQGSSGQSNPDPARNPSPDNTSAQPLLLRDATIDDWEILLDWRNDPLTRAASRETAVVDPGQHREWLQASLQNPGRRIFIAEIGAKPVGTVRIDFDTVCELSWAIAPESRGQGIGRQMVEQAVRLYADRDLRAVARADNLASRRIAEAAGFALVQAEREWMTLERPAS